MPSNKKSWVRMIPGSYFAAKIFAGAASIFFWTGLVNAYGISPSGQATALVGEQSDEAPKSHLVNIQGGVLEVSCHGRGDQLVLLESGYSMGLEGWFFIQSLLSQRYRVCSYNRAGIGRSSRFRDEYDALSHSGRLKQLKETLSPTSPVILVGHSIGGIIGQVYAAEYPEDVSALVLIDSSHPGQYATDLLPSRPDHDSLRSRFLNVIEAVDLLERSFGGEQFTFEFSENSLSSVKKRHAASGLIALAGEQAALENSFRQARDRWPLCALPLLVITAGSLDYPELVPAEFQPFWAQLQKELSELSENGQQVTLEKATHISLLQNEEHARAVAANIVAFIDD